MKVRAYVIDTDAGSAPNYDAPCTTLAVCKPRIRKVASVGDFVIAFAGQGVNPYEPHTVVWAGIVSEKLTFSEYWNDARFAGKKPDRCARPDNFYQPMDGGLLQVGNRVHGPEHFNRDTGGIYVLMFDPSWRFGANGPPLPEEFDLRVAMNARRAGRVISIGDAEWRRLELWLDRQATLTTPATRTNRSCTPAPKKALPPASPRSRCS